MASLKNIVLIEDNEDDYEAVVRGFKHCGSPCPIIWFKDATQAFSFLMQENLDLPALILLDLNLPGLDGRGFLQKLKLNDRLKTIPIVMLTTSSDTKDIQDCYEHGANSYIQKPINFDQMKTIVHSILEYWSKTCLL